MSSFFSLYFIKIKVVQLYNSSDAGTAQKNSHFVSLERSNFYMVDNMLIVIYDEYVNISFSRWDIANKVCDWSTNFRGLAFNVEMVPSYVLLYVNVCI